MAFAQLVNVLDLQVLRDQRAVLGHVLLRLAGKWHIPKVVADQAEVRRAVRQLVDLNDLRLSAARFVEPLEHHAVVLVAGYQGLDVGVRGVGVADLDAGGVCDGAAFGDFNSGFVDGVVGVERIGRRTAGVLDGDGARVREVELAQRALEGDAHFIDNCGARHIAGVTVQGSGDVGLVEAVGGVGDINRGDARDTGISAAARIGVVGKRLFLGLRFEVKRRAVADVEQLVRGGQVGQVNFAATEEGAAGILCHVGFLQAKKNPHRAGLGFGFAKALRLRRLHLHGQLYRKHNAGGGKAIAWRGLLWR